MNIYAFYCIGSCVLSVGLIVFLLWYSNKDSAADNSLCVVV